LWTAPDDAGKCKKKSRSGWRPKRLIRLAEAINFVAGLTESKDTVRVQLEGGMILRWSDCVDLKRRY
jgi:hypothetical protein